MTVLEGLLLAGRLLLAGIFALAGFTKLRDREGSRRSLTDFGLSPELSGPFGVLLPLAELAVAFALVPRGSAAIGALGALALLLAFVAGISVNLARGKTPNCRCFGQLHSEPIGGPILVRNVLLGAVAAFVALAGWADAGPSVFSWLVPLTTAERAVVIGGALALGLLATHTALLARLLRQNQHLMQRLTTAAADAAPVPGAAPVAPYVLPREAGLPVGNLAPEFTLASLNGGTVSLPALRALGKPVVAIFSDPNCGPCTALLSEAAQWQREHAEALTLVVITRGTPEDNAAKCVGLDPGRVLLQRDREVADSFGVLGTPTGVVIRPDGTIASSLAQAEAEIRQLVGRWAPPADSNRPRPLDVAPNFSLPNLEGDTVTLAQFKGKPTLLLFWNPGCSFCQRILRDLRAWETRPLFERAQLLIVSTGSVEENRAQGLSSTILLDPEFSVGPLYGSQATPSAILLDADMRMTGPLVVGTSDVLGLVGQPETPHEEASFSSGERTLSGGFVPLETMPPNAKPLHQECVQDELLPDGSIVLYNGCQRQLLTLNATAALVWDFCDGDHSIDEIVEGVREVFPEAADIDRDVREMIDTLLKGAMIAPAKVTPAVVPASKV